MLQNSTLRLFKSALLLVVCLSAVGRADEPLARPAASPEDKAYQDLAEQVAELEKFGRVFEAVAKLVGPTVVHIQSKRAASFMDQNFTYDETGSGVLVRLPGSQAPYLLTNNHVVDIDKGKEKIKPEQLLITTANGRLLHATYIWKDLGTDVAVLAIAEKDVPVARLGDSDKLEIGHWVLAIGSPFDLSGSVTHGIISGKGRRALKLGSEVRGVLNQDFIQTDAPINPGNSGGPLVNLRGEIVGLNTAIASQSGGSEGVGFTIPINLVMRVAGELIQKGAVTRAYLGINLGGMDGLYPPLDALMSRKLGLPRLQGALVQDVFPDTPAAQAGLQRLDVILEFNGKPVEDLEHLTHMISMTPVGQEASLVVWRDRQQRKLIAKVGDRSEFERQSRGDASRPYSLRKLGIEVQELTDLERTRLGLAGQKGVLITRVLPHNAVAQVVEPFDVIEQVEGKSVTSLAEITQAIKGTKPEEGVRLRVARPAPDGITHLDVILKP